MNRLTTRKEPDSYQVDPSHIEEAIQRLGRYEDILEAFLYKQESIKSEMETLRAQGKMKTGRFRELLGRKVLNQSVLEQFWERGL